MINELTPEFSRLLSISDIGKEGMQINVAANNVECKALAKRFSVKQLEELKAHLRFCQSRRRGVTHLEAHFTAKVVQMCIVTLEPIIKHVEGEFSCTFENNSVTGKEPVVEFELEHKDPPEILNEGIFDVGELLAEHLGLEIDPFPRAEGAEFHPDNSFLSEHSTTKDNPFRALGNLHSKK